MAEESQITKRHKTSEIHTQHDLPQGIPIGEDLDPQIPIPLGKKNWNKTETETMTLKENKNPLGTPTPVKFLMNT